MKLNMKKDWWLANSIYWIFTGLIAIVTGFLNNLVLAGLIGGGLNIIIGIALIQRSKIIFWITFAMGIYTFINQISGLAKYSKSTGNFIMTLPFVFSIILLALNFMLWQQIKKENNHKKSTKKGSR
jgi:hypothetical protein